MPIRFVVFLTALGLIFPRATQAQDQRSYGSVWLSAGLGAGATTSDEFSGSDRFGGSFYARIGGHLNDAWLLGGEVAIWGRQDNDLTPAGGITTRGAKGLAVTGGVGIDIRLGRTVFLTPNLDALFQYFPAGDDPSLTNVILLLTMGLTFR